jgi:hypothetical protein
MLGTASPPGIYDVVQGIDETNRNHSDSSVAAPNPAKLSQLDRLWISPLNPLRGLLPSRPPGEAGGLSFAWRELQQSI